jgi:hypothetical protein
MIANFPFIGGPPLDDEFWHVTEYYENIRSKVKKLDTALGECYNAENLPDRVCNTPLKVSMGLHTFAFLVCLFLSPWLICVFCIHIGSYAVYSESKLSRVQSDEHHQTNCRWLYPEERDNCSLRGTGCT